MLFLQVNAWVKLRGGLGTFFIFRGIPNPLLDPLITKFYKGLRKRANKNAPRAVRRTIQITRALLTKLAHANLNVSDSLLDELL